MTSIGFSVLGAISTLFLVALCIATLYFYGETESLLQKIMGVVFIGSLVTIIYVINSMAALV